jgi:hypothetical protein
MWTFLSYVFAIAAGFCIGFFIAALLSANKIAYLESRQCRGTKCIWLGSYLAMKKNIKGQGAA